MAVIELRPLTLGELLDRTFTYYREHFWLFVGIMAVPETVAVALNLGQTFFATASISLPSQDPNQAVRQVTGMVSAYIAFMALFLVGHSVIYAVALGGTTFAVSEVHLGRQITIRGAFAKLRGKVVRLISTYFLGILVMLGAYAVVFFATFLVVFLMSTFVVLFLGRSQGLQILVGFLALVAFLAGFAGGTLFLLRFSVAISALVLENGGPWQSLKRSYALTQGYVSRIFLVLLLMLVIIVVLAAIFQGPFFIAASMLGFPLGAAPIWLRVPWVLSAGIGGSLAGPFLMIALALVYYDARVRKEGFDLQLMMAAIDPSWTPGVAFPGGPLGSEPGLPPSRRKYKILDI